MRTSFFLSALAAGLVLGGCATKSAGAGAGDEALGDGYYGDDGLSVDPNAAAYDPNDPNVGAFADPAAGTGNFEDRYARVTDAGLEPLYFTFDSYTLPPDEQAKADAAAQYLLNNPQCVMVIEGHCDERGSNEYNLSLSEQRAGGVREYVTAYGIDPARIQTRAFGEEKPADPGHSEEAYRLNRRAEFVPYK